MSNTPTQFEPFTEDFLSRLTTTRKALATLPVELFEGNTAVMQRFEGFTPEAFINQLNERCPESAVILYQHGIEGEDLDAIPVVRAWVDLIELFEEESRVKRTFMRYEDDDTDFSDVVMQRSGRPDLHVMMLLDTLCPGRGDMVSAAEHDQIWFDVDIEQLEKSGITDEQIRELIACGVFLDDCGLSMFV